jgi:adenylylsulfate kinase
LKFSAKDRTENIRRLGEVSKLFVDAGIVVLAAFISPFRSDRDAIRSSVKKGDFIEIYCNASLKVCEGRDQKGLYKKARNGEISDFTGINSPYEKPKHPEITVLTGKHSADHCVQQIVDYLDDKGKLAIKCAVKRSFKWSPKINPRIGGKVIIASPDCPFLDIVAYWVLTIQTCRPNLHPAESY